MADTFSPELNKLLIKFLNDNINEYNLEVTRNKKGDGFASEILFITLTNKKVCNKKHLVLKQQPDTIIEHLVAIYSNETWFYKAVWPSLQKFYMDVSGNIIDFVPKCYGTTDDARNSILMENLRNIGYCLYDKSTPLDVAHFELIFKTYGIFHGISLALKIQNRKEYIRLLTPLIKLRTQIFSEGHFLTKLLIDRFKDSQEYFDPLTESHIIEKLLEYEKNGINLINETWTSNGVQGVITHGDCWSNNMMFKYDVSLNFIGYFIFLYWLYYYIQLSLY